MGIIGFTKKDPETCEELRRKLGNPWRRLKQIRQ
ncbi:unnamed protein product [Nippostrongylus brasiliensis]|uniref:Transcriptional regulator n=1 Tax=Nippostrongylus brasiliensis TaxID=27835 RepID=A0A0N4XFL9_NIPBR|nr:unnamed protein product [Nippostrongylus brasiliensis]